MKGFGRRNKSRDMMIRNLASSLVLYESIVTTKEKGKAVKRFLDKLISKTKKQKTTSQFNAMRSLKKELPDIKAVEKVFDILIENYMNVNGGYIKMFPYYPRASDNAKRVKLILK